MLVFAKETIKAFLGTLSLVSPTAGALYYPPILWVVGWHFTSSLTMQDHYSSIIDDDIRMTKERNPEEKRLTGTGGMMRRRPARVRDKVGKN